MPHSCFACLQELPPSTTEEEGKFLRNLQCNEDLARTYQKKTGIVINTINDSPKQLCEICYNKIRAFDEFCETALDCSTALCELLLEEDFSLRTLKNLQYFCNTCLSQMKDETGDSLNLNNTEVKRWLDKCNKLKIRTGTEHWPTSICERCCKKIDKFLEFQYTAKQAFKQINKSSSPQHRDIQKTNYQAEKHINVAHTSPLVENARNNQLSNQDIECVEETVVSTSYNVKNNVNAATFTDEQRNDTTGIFTLENKINNREKSHLMSKQSFEVTSVESIAVNQPSSTEYSLKKQCIKPKHRTNIKQNQSSTQLSPIKEFLCNQCRKVFKNRARLKRHKRYSLSCSKK
uniref:Longitudinals lacking protein, isoforms N/O/W/X/Y n=1 Tax=Zeugodacus cucurbitae TaxID=28588 RepID=A0A0A1WRI7_ZEUCU